MAAVAVIVKAKQGNCLNPNRWSWGFASWGSSEHGGVRIGAVSRNQFPI